MLIWKKSVFAEGFSINLNILNERHRFMIGASVLYICYRRNGSVWWNGLIKRNLIFLNTVKIIYVRICNPTIFALHTLGVKLCFHPWNNHIKVIEYTFTLKYSLDTKVHFLNNCKEIKCCLRKQELICLL